MKLLQIAKINQSLMELQTQLQPNNDWHGALEKLNEAIHQKPDMTVAAVSKIIEKEMVTKNGAAGSITVKDYAASIRSLRGIFETFGAKKPVNELNAYLKLLDRYRDLDMAEFRSLLILATQKKSDSRTKNPAQQEDAVNYYIQQILEWQNDIPEMGKIIAKMKSDKRVKMNEVKSIYQGVTGYIDKKKTKKAYISAIEAKTFELKLQSERLDILKQ